MDLTPPEAPRNPGPAWGFRFLRGADRVIPEPVFRPLRAAGTWVAVALMPRQRRHSRAYLRQVLGREPRRREVFRHFFAACEALMLRLRVAGGRAHRCVLGPDAPDFAAWLASRRPALLGTFHLGDSDLAGFMLAAQERLPMRIVRMRVGNSDDVDALARRIGGSVRFVWVNRPDELLFALKESGLSDETVALQCDRAETTSRTETFRFLGAPRRFPFTIYHLALIFGRPVILAFAVPTGSSVSTVHASPAFEPDQAEPRERALARAREHFQAFLGRVEGHLRIHPEHWLNFRPL